MRPDAHLLVIAIFKHLVFLDLDVGLEIHLIFKNSTAPTTQGMQF